MNKRTFQKFFIYKPISYFRGQVLSPLFNSNDDNKISLQQKPYHLMKYIQSKIYNYDNKKVDIFIVGAQKAGTTALHNFLIQHPQIISSYFKEVHYFDYERYFNSMKDRNNFSHYRAMYPTNINDNHLMIDSTPSYIFKDYIINRVHKYNPNAKIIAILRNPIKRAHSQYNHQRSLFGVVESFEECLRKEDCLDSNIKFSRNYSYVSRGMYYNQVKALFRLFKKENISILFSKDLKQNTDETLKEVFKFIGIKNIQVSKKIDTNSREYPTMKEETRQMLIEKFKPDIIKLEHLLDLDLSRWLK